jgi:hypothetical protein
MNMTLRKNFALARLIGRFAIANSVSPGAILFVCLLLPFQIGCATTHEPVPAFAAREVNPPTQPPGFETPPLLDAVDVLPPELLSGPHHELESRVINDGYTNHYVVLSDYGDFPAAGRVELEQRVAEVQAITIMREMTRRDVYKKGAVAGAKRTAFKPVREVKRYIDNPLHLVRAVPGEAMRIVGIIEDVRKIARMGLTKAYLKDLIGYEDARKDLAKHLGVSPGSPNPVMHAELNQAAWSYYGGSAPMYLLEQFMPLAPIPNVTLVAGGESLGEGLKMFSNEVGGKSISRQLRKMGVEKSDRKAFKNHPAYSSRDRKNIVRSLYRVDDASGRETFVTYALDAKSKDDASAMVRQAQTVAVYDATYDDVVEMTRSGDVVLCYTRSGVVMMPLYADYVAWTHDFAQRVEVMGEWSPEMGDVEGREIWVAGEFTDWAQRELDERAVAVHENAIDVLTKAANEIENNKNGLIAKFRRNKAGRAMDRLANAVEN